MKSTLHHKDLTPHLFIFRDLIERLFLRAVHLNDDSNVLGNGIICFRAESPMRGLTPLLCLYSKKCGYVFTAQRLAQRLETGRNRGPDAVYNNG